MDKMTVTFKGILVKSFLILDQSLVRGAVSSLFRISIFCSQVARNIIAKSKRTLIKSPVKSPVKTVRKKPRSKWNILEERSLVEFISLHGDLLKQQTKGTTWPATKDEMYWTEAACYVNRHAN